MWRFFTFKRHYKLKCFVVFLLVCGFLKYSLFTWHDEEDPSTSANLYSTKDGEFSTNYKYQDNYYLVTAIGSGEFNWLLNFIDALTAQSRNSEFQFIIWTLDLRQCEQEFLLNLKRPFSVQLNRFPYHFHELHIRQYHLTAIRPIVLSLTSATYGEVIWIEPGTELTFSLEKFQTYLGNEGFVVGSTHAQLSKRQCLANVIGVNKFKRSSFLGEWLVCVKNKSCIEKAISESKYKPEPGVDILLDIIRQKNRIPCSALQSFAWDGVKHSTSATLDQWKNKHEKLCQRQVCVLSGSHRTNDCMASQLDRLRQNKVSYARRHNYRYIEDTFGFHREGPCRRVWNKIHAILKYLPDCKMLMWIDTDAIFVNMEKSLESFMEPYPEIELIFTWYKKEAMLNAGVFLVRGSPLVREFFVNVTAGYAWTRNHCIYSRFEQAAINDQLNSGTVDGKYLYERTNAMQNLCGFGNRECLPTETDFILHLAPLSCPYLGDIIKKFFDKNPQLH